jgi:hypothetical protein
MAKIEGEVIPTSGGEHPYKVVIRHEDGTILSEEGVASEAEGEDLINVLLTDLGRKAKEDGSI